MQTMTDITPAPDAVTAAQGLAAPQIIRRRHTKGYRHPEGTLMVTRGTVFGNRSKIVEWPKSAPYPFTVGGYGFYDYEAAANNSVSLYRRDMEIMQHRQPAVYAAIMRRVLAAPFVACSCVPGSVCHAPVLVELALAWRAGGGE